MKKQTGGSEPVTKEYLDEVLRDRNDEILSKLDDIVGQLETLREENTIGTYQISNLQTAVDNQEERLTVLEHKH